MLFGDCALHCAVKLPMPAGRPPRKVALDAGTLAVAFNGERAREGTRSERLCHPATRRAALSLCSVLYLPAWSGLGSCVFCDHPPLPRLPPTARSPLPQTFFPREPNVVEISSCSVPLPKKDVCWLAPPSSGFPRACMESATARLFGDTGEQRHTLLPRATEWGGGGERHRFYWQK